MSESDHIKKFMFDRHSFDLPQEDREKPPPPVFTEEDVEKIKQDSFALGKSAGLEEARQAQEEMLIGLLQDISGQLQTLSENEAVREEEKNNAVIRLTLKIIEKFFPDFMRQERFSEIEHMMMEIMRQRKDTPQIVVTIHEDLLNVLKERIDTIAANAGFQGQVVIMASSGMAISGCRVEWADGGAEKNPEYLYKAVEAALLKQLMQSENGKSSSNAKKTGEE